MKIKNLLIANRGEIAIRVMRAATELGIGTVAVCSPDDVQSLHTKTADRVVTLEGRGAAAYLNEEGIIAAAKAEGCDAIHPGYGFLSEKVSFARRCAEEGIVFVGPTVEQLALFGDKVQSRDLARRCGVPLLPGTAGAATFKEAAAFFKKMGPGASVMIKALAGGGGRGMRPVQNMASLEEAYTRCQSEALAAFGNGDVFVERLILRPRHIEIQIVGDGAQVIHLGERDCTMQRRNQKLIEITPGPTLSAGLRKRLTDAALRMAREVQYRSLGTFEFLIDEAAASEESSYAFMEVNPRLQVEHTVTEEVTGVDLVVTQLEIAAGKSLTDLGFTGEEIKPRGYALQLRINMETMDAEGSCTPECGVLSAYEVPGGKGIRVDGYGYRGYAVNPSFDSLLAKLIVHSATPRYADAIRKAYQALTEFRIEGVATNIPFLQNLLCRPEVIQNDFYTRFIEEHAAELAIMSDQHRRRFFKEKMVTTAVTETKNSQPIPPGMRPIRSTMQGRIVDIEVTKGDAVAVGQKLCVMEAMKMEHIITADRSGYIQEICIALGDMIPKGALMFLLMEADVAAIGKEGAERVDLDAIRPDLAKVIARHAFTFDENRPEAVAKRRKKNQRTARENINDLCDPGSFIEYGALIHAAQLKRRSLDDLIRRTPADGLISGVGSVNGEWFDYDKARCMVLAYDFTVLAGTQGTRSHQKLDRVLDVANQWKLPIVVFAEGGGGRPGDTDMEQIAGLHIKSFTLFPALSGKVPLVGILEGPCFAGNACLLGCCDVIIATRHSCLGMGGPAMIEGGGLGVVRPEEIGPIDVQTQNGVVDVAVEDEREAVAVAKKYLSYFQGTTAKWEMADQRELRWLIPENRLRVYDVRKVIETLADKDSVLELRKHFGLGMITALIRIEGRPFGLVANNPAHMSGAIEPEGADKAARFMNLCNIHGLPILSLCDTPGFMVGPEVEMRAHVRHSNRLFLVGAHLSVPLFAVVLRKGYGLGAQAMVSGSFHNPFFTVSWPTGEFGGMGLEGGVRLALKKELAAIADPKEREETFQLFVAAAYEMGEAINMATHLEIDGVIDPAETRRWVMRGLRSAGTIPAKPEISPFVDAW